MLLTPIDSLRYRVMVFGGLMVTGALIALYLASYFFLLKLANPGLPPMAATPLTVVYYWQQYGTDPYTRFWLTVCMVAGSLPVVAAAIAIARPVNRGLHGDARFASLREVERAGMFGPTGIILGRWGRRYLI